ncbi:MAG TPA: ATP-binding protein [Steroidobacteraceae bacterium]|jgi:two-component system sensor histidine kinase UhpB|nr:ATP-binding protein [Steroidobacteraceae bacterium]
MSLPTALLDSQAWLAPRQSRRRVGISLKLRLSLLITLLIALMMLAGGAYIVREARQDIRDEVRSTMNLTGHFLDAQLALLQDRGLQLKQLRDIRHLEVNFYDDRGALIDTNEAHGERKPAAPAWFVWMVRVSTLPMEASRRMVMVNGVTVGQLVIQPDPTYEIDEIWDTSSGLLLLLFVFCVLVNALVWWAVSHALRPVEYILGALGRIERGQLDARLPAFGLAELSRISVGFNHMAATLERSLAENHSLTRRLMQMQEEEREHLARELHDEIGQCVTAIHADAVAIRNRGGAAVHESAQSIVEAIGRIKQMVRSMLKRLHPGALESLGLGAALRELTGAFRQRHPQVSCTLSMAQESSALQGELGITLYRIVQECLTNISRHAEAVNVEISVSQEPIRVELSVHDDGRGFDPASAARGFGLIGIRERVKALGGSCCIESASGRGTTIVAQMPLHARSARQ